MNTRNRRMVALSTRNNRVFVGLYWREGKGNNDDDLKDVTFEFTPARNNVTIEQALKQLSGGRWDILIEFDQVTLTACVPEVYNKVFDNIAASPLPLRSLMGDVIADMSGQELKVNGGFNHV